MITLRDSITLLRRNLLHLLRYPSLTVTIIAMPVIFLLLFVYVFGGTMGHGLPGGTGRSSYLHYITPAILVMTIVAVAQSTAILIAKDSCEGIIDRLRTMPISRSAPLIAHVLAALVQTAVAVTVVLGLALAIGYRSPASLFAWSGAVALVLAMAWAVTWLCIGIGLASGSVEAASNAPMPLVLLPFLSSGFVPTNSMPTWLGWVAQHQPFTPIINTLRAALDGSSAGADVWWAMGWCAAISVLCFVWSGRLFGRVRAV